MGVSYEKDEVIRGLATTHSRQGGFTKGQRVQRGRQTEKNKEWGRKSELELEGRGDQTAETSRDLLSDMLMQSTGW